MSHRSIAGLLCALTLSLAACGSSDEHTIAEIAASDPRLETLSELLSTTGLDETLNGSGPFTLFAPTDEAFELLPDDFMPSGMEVTQILLYHVVEEEIRAAGVVALDEALTAQGGSVAIQLDGDTVVLDGRVQVTTTDIVADNGVIHLIDAVLVPGAFPGTIVDMLVASPRFSTLTSAAAANGLAGGDALDDPAGSFTLFAPTDTAFASLPADALASGAATVLSYHALGSEVDSAAALAAAGSSVPTLAEDPGNGNQPFELPVDLGVDAPLVLDGRVQVTFVDIETANGVVHVVDSVLFPGDFPGTIADLLAASPRFATLRSAVLDSGLDGALSAAAGNGGLTLFAPTNAGFARLPDGLLGEVDVPLVLQYHVIGSLVDSTAAVAADGTTVPTLALDAGKGNAPFALAVDLDADSDLFLDGRSELSFVDIPTSNGIVHVLDSVLIPGGDFPGSLVEALAAYPRFDALVSAVLSEGLAGAVSEVTLFAPTNDAFAGADLMGEPLSRVLPYHLLDEVKASGALGASETTLLGETIGIDADMSGVRINGSVELIRLDVAADDGILHVIDGVLVPPPAL